MGERKRDGKKEMKKEKRERERETLHCAPPLKAKHFFWAGLFPFSACVFRRRRRRRRRSSNPKRRSPDDWTSTSITSLSFPVFCFSLPS
jgi:hypothetical protein